MEYKRMMTFFGFTLSTDYFSKNPWTISKRLVPWLCIGKKYDKIRMFSIGPFAMMVLRVPAIKDHTT